MKRELLIPGSLLILLTCSCSMPVLIQTGEEYLEVPPQEYQNQNEGGEPPITFSGDFPD